MASNIYTRIKRLVNQIVKQHGTRCPLKLSKALDIDVVYKQYSNNTKGYFINILRNKYIVVNSSLDEESQNIVIAHELGHAILHSSAPICFIREHTLFPTGRYEIEANKFAAELLVDEDDEKVIYKSVVLACLLGIRKELVDYKLL